MSEDQMTIDVSPEILNTSPAETVTEPSPEPSVTETESVDLPASETPASLSTEAPASSDNAEVSTVASESDPVVAKTASAAKNKTRRPKSGQNRSAQSKTAQAKKPRQDGEQGDHAVYKPEEIIQRLQGRSGVYRAYLFEVQTLLAHIKMVGLGPALAVLLAQTDHKSKRRIYWDISKWVFKEQKIKGKNNRSLMESIVYGDSKFLLKATHSVVRFLEELDQLSRENPPQSTSGSQT